MIKFPTLCLFLFRLAAPDPHTSYKASRFSILPLQTIYVYLYRFHIQISDGSSGWIVWRPVTLSSNDNYICDNYICDNYTLSGYTIFWHLTSQISMNIISALESTGESGIWREICDGCAIFGVVASERQPRLADFVGDFDDFGNFGDFCHFGDSNNFAIAFCRELKLSPSRQMANLQLVVNMAIRCDISHGGQTTRQCYCPLSPAWSLNLFVWLPFDERRLAAANRIQFHTHTHTTTNNRLLVVVTRVRFGSQRWNENNLNIGSPVAPTMPLTEPVRRLSCRASVGRRRRTGN